MNLSFWTDPWQSPTILWLAVTAAFTAIACGLPGAFLVLRRMSLTGDAISHSVLPGIVIGFLVSGTLDSPWIILGAAFSGWLTVMVIEFFHRKAGVREDAATGVVFTAMFSIGVLLLRQFAGKVDLDPDCVLFGNLETAIHGETTRFLNLDVPNITLTSGAAAAGAILFITLLYHRLLATSFDPVLSKLTDQAPARSQSMLLGATAAVVVAAFQTVGAVMSVALLVLPAASALLVSKRLPGVLTGVILHAVLSSIGGIYLATWANCNLGAAIILTGGVLFIGSFFRFKLRF
ncbi:MAG: metal ABC transporter permease [Akkermansiaceae bacterium]|nr:metal ABC transporter permease [Akkermansiaceae bacterium]